MTDEMQAFFRALAAMLAEQGWLQLSFLEVGGQPVATYFCFDYGGDILVYNSGYDPAAVPQLSPGWVLLSQLIRHAITWAAHTSTSSRATKTTNIVSAGVDSPVYRTLIRQRRSEGGMRVIAGKQRAGLGLGAGRQHPAHHRPGQIGAVQHSDIAGAGRRIAATWTCSAAPARSASRR